MPLEITIQHAAGGSHRSSVQQDLTAAKVAESGGLQAEGSGGPHPSMGRDGCEHSHPQGTQSSPTPPLQFKLKSSRFSYA